MNAIYTHCWKSQREQRKNRSFIREFWCYQDEDDYTPFKRIPSKQRMGTRKTKDKQRIHNYHGCLIERENAIIHSKQLKAMYLRVEMY